MDKLFEFRTGERGDENSKYYRFQCDCLSSLHAFDVGVDSCGVDNEGKYITLTWHMVGASFGDRMRYAWQILKPHRTWADVIVRDEDSQYLSNIFDTSKKFSELP